MKLASLLTQYLFAHNRLELPGIGIFLLDPAAVSAVENSKQRNPLTEGITFESNPGLKESPDLVQYIAARTGKMKALAEADLHSHVELAQQFLNIGKPFYFEGIGTVARVRAGEYEFAAGAIIPAKPKETAQDTSEVVKKEDKGEYESFLTRPRQPLSWSRPVIAMAVIAGIAIAIWGGYRLSTPAEQQVQYSTPEPTPVAMVTTPKQETPAPIPTATPTATQTEVTNTDNYKYVLEVAKAERAMKRYNQLRTNLWKVELETTDSVQYKLYLMLPRQYGDTTRVMDSLTVMTGRKVYIEHPL